MNNILIKTSKQSGVSLIEIMIALIIGMILTAGAIQIFISSKATYRLESALSRMQETGRFIVDTMAKEIRMAGYNGCSSRGTIETNTIADNPPPASINADDALLGYQATGTNTWSPSLPSSMTVAMYDIGGDATKDLVSGTDVVLIQRADSCGASVSGNWDVTNANVQVSYPNGCGFAQNQVVMVTDCSTADVFALGNNPSGSGNLQTLNHSTNNNTGNFLGKNYGPESQIFVYRSNIFFIAPDDNGEPAFYLASWAPSDSNTTITAADYDILELADGVQDMQILYGVDNAGGDDYADNYLTADAVTDWNQVRSVRVNLLLQSADRITEEPRSFTFNGAEANTSNDRRLRMLFSDTITLRNRLQ